MRQKILTLLILLNLTSCSWRRYPPENYSIPKVYRDLISSYKTGDTLKFQDDKGNLSTFLIPKIDSSIIDKRGYFINQTEYKAITISCHELTNARSGYEDYDIITIEKDPKTNSVGFNLRLKNFYSIDTSFPFVLKTDTLKANNHLITNYYAFRPYNYTEQKESSSVNEIVMTNKDGIVAYKNLDGTWWTKE